MINLRLKSVILLLSYFYCFTTSAQVKTPGDAFIQKATTAASDLVTKRPAEKVYLHLDKPYYAAGDDIWFKAYVTIGAMHEMSDMSGTLTIELLNEKGGLMQAIKLPVKFGLAAGDFHIPNTSAAGKYQVRAYTNYMRNWGSEYFFNQPIYVTAVTTNDKPSGGAKKALKEAQSNQPATGGTLAALADVQFFPEGGNLINGVDCRIAFKATGPDGKGIAFKGWIIDNKGDEIAQFSSLHLGMGSFGLNPIAGVNYIAKLTFADGSQSTVKLPAASNDGYVLSVSNRKVSPTITCQIVYNHQLSNDSTLVLIAQSAGYVYYVAKSKLKGTDIIARIPKDKLPTGITQLTLFRQNGEPVAERLVFIDNHDQLNITLTDSNKVNHARQLTTIRLNVNDGENKTYGSFSATVIDDTKAPDDELAGRENILSYLLLSSELKGKIESPGYYFKSDTAATNLDLLMMTQGYRHFEWKKILNNQLPTLTYQPQKGLTISGQLLSLAGKPLTKANVTLFDRQARLLLDTVTNEHGEFAFNNMLFADSINVLITGKTKDDRNNLQIKLDKTYSSVTDMPTEGDPKNPAMITLIKADTVPAVYRQLADEKFKKFPTNGVTILKEVDIKAVAEKPKVSESSANLNGAGNADQVLTGKDIESLAGGDLCQVLGAGRLLGATVVNGKLISTMAGMGKGSRAMLIVLDGGYYNGDLCAISSFDVESIEILRTPGYTAIYGSRGGNGVAVITTKHGGAGNYEPPGNAAKFTITGFYKAREFYSPKYDGSSVNSQLADLRSTIYWNPNVFTDKEGNASFSFYNAGAKATYRVIVQGIDVNGKLGYQVLKYTVE